MSLILNSYKIFCRYILLITGLLLINTAAFASAPVSSKTMKNDYYLFIQTAETAQLEFNPKEKNYALTLEHIDPTVIYFSNIPRYEADFMDTSKFLAVINNNITNYHPQGLNAALVGMQPDTHTMRKYILSLRNPVYIADKKRVTFTAIMAPLNPNTLEKTAENIPDNFTLKKISLFIDGICISCITP